MARECWSAWHRGLHSLNDQCAVRKNEQHSVERSYTRKQKAPPKRGFCTGSAEPRQLAVCAVFRYPLAAPRIPCERRHSLVVILVEAWIAQVRAALVAHPVHGKRGLHIPHARVPGARARRKPGGQREATRYGENCPRHGRIRKPEVDGATLSPSSVRQARRYAWLHL